MTEQTTHPNTFQIDSINGVAIVYFSGYLDETNADSVFASLLDYIETEHPDKMIFDMSRLQYLNSKAIGYIAELYMHSKERGKKFVFAALSDHIFDVFELVWLTELLVISDTAETALSELQS